MSLPNFILSLLWTKVLSLTLAFDLLSTILHRTILSQFIHLIVTYVRRDCTFLIVFIKINGTDVRQTLKKYVANKKVVSKRYGYLLRS